MAELSVQVVDRRDEAHGVFSLELAASDGGALPAWEPGAHIDVAVGAAGVRQYSLCGDDGRWRIGILHERAGRGGSDHLYRTAHVGTELQVSLPRNNFQLEEAAEYVFVAGGIGITPILPMIAAADSAGADWTLYYGGRTLGHMAFVDHVSRHHPRSNVLPQDEFGLLPLDSIIGARPAAVVYACGPAPMLDAVEAVGRTHGAQVRMERFTPIDIGDRTDLPFEVRLAGTGATYRVEAGQSAVDVLERAGVPIVTSCREGTCGSCETTVLAGDIDHRDSLLTEAERAANTSMMLCVSRARGGTVVLDL